MQVAAIKPDPGAVEPHKGIVCMDVTAGRFFVAKMPPKALYQTIIVLRGGAPFCPLEVLTVRVWVQEDVLPLNKIGKMPLVPSEIGSQVENNLVIGTRSL